jgi:hypothetical protein
MRIVLANHDDFMNEKTDVQPYVERHVFMKNPPLDMRKLVSNCKTP